MKRWLPAALAFLLAFMVSAPFAARHAPSYDGFVMSQVAISIVDEHTPLVHPIDRFGLNTPYSGYGIGNSLVMSALLRFGDAAGLDGGRTMKLTNPLLFSAMVAGTLVLLRRRGYPPGVAAAVTAVVAVGTPLLHGALLDYSEPGVALAVVLGLLGLDGVEKRVRTGPLAVGASIGAAVLFRSDSWLLVVPAFLAALWFLGDRNWRELGSAGLALAPFAAVWAGYNVARFGSPLTSGYDEQTFSNPLMKGLYGLALSPGRGVFVYVPLILACIAIVPLLGGSARVMGAVAVSMLVLRLLLYARWWSWYGGGGWGPRFIAPALPAFAPLLAEVAIRWWRVVVVQLAAVATVTMGLIGFAVGVGLLPSVYGQPPYDFRAVDRLPPDKRAEMIVRDWTSDEYLRATDDVMFDWSRFPARR